MNSYARIFCLVASATILLVSPAIAWQKTKSTNYQSVVECESDNLCLLVSCPVRGRPSLEMLIYEFGRATGEEIVLRVDGRDFALALPERGAHDLYRWDLTPELADALVRGRRAEIDIDPGGESAPISMQGSSRAITRVLNLCSGG